MLTSGGVSRKDAATFNAQARNDLRIDAVDRDTSPHFFAINDDYYNHADADRDINCIFPIERLSELAAAGEIGEVAPHHYSGFMGRIYIRTAVVNEAATQCILRPRCSLVAHAMEQPAMQTTRAMRRPRIQ